MGPSKSPFSPPRLFVALLVVLGTTYYLFHAPGQGILPSFKSDVVQLTPKELFVKQMLEEEIDGPYNLEPLAALCRNKEQAPGLIIKCKAVPGGMGNVRNMMLNCYRFAIEAGGLSSGIIVPEIMKRGEDSLSNLFTDISYPFEHFFELPHFTTSFRTACPQIRLYDSQNDLWDLPSTAKEHEVDPQSLSAKHHPVANTLIDEAGQWRGAFYKWLNETAPPFSESRPVLVSFPPQLLRFPFKYDTPEFVATFGRLLLIREDVRKLAATVLYSLSSQYNLSLNLSGPIQQEKFYGAHLRTASDAAAVGWPGYDMQATNYLNSALASNLSLIYLTTGNPVDAARFSETAASKGITVTTKDALLAGEEFEFEREVMKRLSWDHLGMVDFDVLLRASKFGGMFESSFSWNTALRRHVIVSGGSWQEISPENQGVGEDDPACFDDALSTVFGPQDMGGVRWQFPMGLYP
ncbi:hypothetical protein LSUE1_G007122 [Lachnellula suecica]|uniref:Alternative oxidase n=1 Tax=Lachnellula suecica TaxID=602035 RepID=A0A8T9CA60_9HELO|nr:hypothetical protein LSUE1_G007122 [Lachnellula suecica]